MVLKCQVKDHEDSSLQWSNPAQQTSTLGRREVVSYGVISLPWAEERGCRAERRCPCSPEAKKHEGKLFGESTGHELLNWF